MQDSYSVHFGLALRPFSPLPDAAGLHWTPGHVRAHAALEYGLISGAAFVMLTGPAGTGKTALLLHMMAEASDAYRFAMVATPTLQPGGDVAPWILQSLGAPVPSDAGPVDLFTRLQDLLIAEYAAGRRTVLIFDEAQDLCPRVLDQLRLLTNLNTARDQLLQVILAGRPPLEDRIRAPEQAAIAQRIAAWGRLDDLDRVAISDYVNHRVTVAGGPSALFEADALDLVQYATGGTPRLINQLCELAIIYSAADRLHSVTAAVVQRVLDEGVFFPPRPEVDLRARLHLATGTD